MTPRRFQTMEAWDALLHSRMVYGVDRDSNIARRSKPPFPSLTVYVNVSTPFASSFST